MKLAILQTNQMKVDPRSYERNYMQLRKEAWKKFRTSTGFETSNPVEVLNFLQASYAIAYNCVHNCEDQPSFEFISAVHMINFIYITFNLQTLG